jgi:hypothetical protein
MDDLQALVDGLSVQWQRERAETQITLGKMIEVLDAMSSDVKLNGISNPHSYRGYYNDLAFEPGEGKTTAVDALAMCRAAMGQVFEGYKGGDFVMGALTPLWLANYGCCGKKIMAIHQDGTFEIANDD